MGYGAFGTWMPANLKSIALPSIIVEGTYGESFLRITFYPFCNQHYYTSKSCAY
jgi:hypothetical protein